MTGTDLTVSETPTVHTLVRPVVTPAALIENHKLVAEIVAKALQQNVDYGVIPGTGTKPTLLKPGAERLAKAFACTARYVIVEAEKDHNFRCEWMKRRKVWDRNTRGKFTWAEESGTSLGLYRYVVRCELVLQATGEVVGDGLGSCSTMESKYVDRPRDSENTVLKMGCKRALIAATLNAFGLSDRFTQDVEEFHDEPEPTPVEPKPDVVRPKQRERFAAILAKDIWTPEEKDTYTTAEARITTGTEYAKMLDDLIALGTARKNSDPGVGA